MVNETRASLYYISDGSTLEWPIPFPFLAMTHLLIVRSDGVNAVQDIDYSVGGTPDSCDGYVNGGTLTWLLGQNPPEGVSFSIVRKAVKTRVKIVWTTRSFRKAMRTRLTNRLRCRKEMW